MRRKYLKAAVVMVLFAALVEGLIIIETIRPAGLPEYSEIAVVAGILAIMGANAVAEGYHLSRRGHLAAGGRLDEMYSQALYAYISSEDRKAEELLSAALRFDALDADLLFLRGEVAARLGRTRRAGRFFRKCRDFDEKGKWKWETQNALDRL